MSPSFIVIKITQSKEEAIKFEIPELKTGTVGTD